jgi:uncharacterized protein YfaP (DUF2135 family)
MRVMPPPAPGVSAREMPVAAAPPPAGAAAESDIVLQEVDDLQRRVARGQRRGWWLSLSALAAVLAGLACWGAYYRATVLSYARVSDVHLFRVTGDDERLAVVFQPDGHGTIGFGRVDAGRQTQLLDRIDAAAVGQRQEFLWRVRGVQTGDVVQVTYRQGWRLTTADLLVPSEAGVASRPTASSQQVAGGVAVRGTVVSAIDKEPVARAAVRLLGTRLAAETDANGQFELSGVPADATRITVSAEGYAAETFDRVAGRASGALRVALNPGMEAGQIRIVLTWGEEASDLDAHLEGPLPHGERFHVYYHQPGDLKSREFVRLDTDDRGNGGPETITVLGVLPGTYRFFVHDYGNRDKPDANDLARSEAEVKVYQGGQTYRFRAAGESPGNLWDVCTIEVTASGAVVRKVDAYQGIQSESLGLYAKRTMADREQWLGDSGGTTRSERAVGDALDWLARHQLPDGAWGSRGLGHTPGARCDAASPCLVPGRKHDTAHTGLALLAFQAGGHFHFNNARYSQSVRRGLDWLVSRQANDGAIVDQHPRDVGFVAKNHMYEHGIATFALADACAAAVESGAAVPPRYRTALAHAVAFIERTQHDDGGWRYTLDKREPSDMSVSGWPVLALKSAKEAGVSVSPLVIRNVRQFFQRRLRPNDRGRSNYERDGQIQTDATTGVGMLGRQFLFNEPDAAVVHQAAEYLAELAEQNWGLQGDEPPDYYLWYNCTLAMFMHGGEPWQRWNNVVRDRIVELQCRDGCSRGSWDPSDPWGAEQGGGRIYSTAMAVLSLQVYYRYTPPSEQAIEFEVYGRAADEPGAIVAPEPAGEGKANRDGAR